MRDILSLSLSCFFFCFFFSPVGKMSMGWGGQQGLFDGFFVL